MCQRPAPSNPHHSNKTHVADGYRGFCKAALMTTNAPETTSQPGLLTRMQVFTMYRPTMYFPVDQEDAHPSFAKAAAAHHCSDQDKPRLGFQGFPDHREAKTSQLPGVSKARD